MITLPTRVLNSVRNGPAIVVGDSIAATWSTATTPPGPYFNSTSFWSWADMLSGYRLRTAIDGGVSGERTDQVAARLPALLATKPQLICLNVGINDIVQNIATATIIAQTVAMWDMSLANGTPVIHVPILTDTAVTSPQRQAIADLFYGLLRAARTRPGVIYIGSIRRSVLDPATPTSYGAGKGADSRHLSMLGAYYVGREVASAINLLVPPLLDYGSGLDQAELAANPWLSGSGGTLGGSITGVAPSGWIATQQSASITAVGSKVTRTDYTGEWYQLAISANSGGGQVYRQAQAAGSLWNANDGFTYQGTVEVEWDAGFSGAILPVVDLRDASSVIQRNLGIGGITAWPSPMTGVAGRAILKTREFVIIPGTTVINVTAQIPAGGVGTVRFGSISCHRVA